MILSQFTNKFNRLCTIAISLAIFDGGAIIAIQTLDFLITHFFTQVPQVSGDLQTIASSGKVNLLIPLLNMLNLSAIVIRVSGVAHGLKYPIIICYRKALSRLPSLILLYLGLALTAASLVLQLNKIWPVTLATFVTANAKLIMLGILGLVPLGILACIFIVNENKNPIQTVISIYKYLRYECNFLILATIAIMYSFPLAVGSMFVTASSLPFFALATSIWLLFCHLLTMSMYIDSAKQRTTNEEESKKPTKVVII